MGYNTRDSDIYLLPVAWLMALWLAQGLLTQRHLVAAGRYTAMQRGWLHWR
jgi:hypothetical protein